MNLRDFIKNKKKLTNGWSLTYSSDDGNAGDIRLIYYENGERKILKSGFDWYFFVSMSDLPKVQILNKSLDFKFTVGEKWIKIFYSNKEYQSTAVREFVNTFEQAGIKTYEGDVGPIKRLLLDSEYEIEDLKNIKVLYFDIETDDTKDGITVGESMILSFAGVDMDGKEYFLKANDLTDESERELLKSINALLYQFDMIIGWNSDNFDREYLLKRFKKYRISGNYLWNMLHLDMMRRTQDYFKYDKKVRSEIKRWSLDSVSEYFLKEGKIQKTSKVIELYKNQPELFREYNLQDCKLLKKLEEKIGVIDLTYRMFQWCKVFPRDWSSVKTIDNFILTDANRRMIHYRTNFPQRDEDFEKTEESQQYLGAFVIDPPVGYYENVYVFDFASLYPNIIRTFNISPDSKAIDDDEAIVIPTAIVDEKTYGGQKFSKNRQGVISGKIGYLLDKRSEIKTILKSLPKRSVEYQNLSSQQAIVKELANSVYGVMGNKYCRFFDPDFNLAEIICVVGRYLIVFVQELMEKNGRKVITGDTDSIFVQLDKDDDLEKITDWINTEIEMDLKNHFNIDKCTIMIGLDKKFDQFIITAKKKYVGKSGEDYNYTGMELIKRDTVKIAIDFQRQLIDHLFEKHSVEFLKTWLNEKKKALFRRKIEPDDIAIYKRIGKKLTDYKNPPIHVQIALQKSKKDKDVGNSIAYIVTDGSKKLQGIHIDDFDGNFDREYYWNSVVYPLLERLLEAVYPGEKWGDFYEIKRKALRKVENAK